MFMRAPNDELVALGSLVFLLGREKLNYQRTTKLKTNLENRRCHVAALRFLRGFRGREHGKRQCRYDV